MTTIKLRRGTAAQWASANPTLALGEPGFDTTNNVLKVGDGSTAWAGLAGYLNETALTASTAEAIAEQAMPARLYSPLTEAWGQRLRRAYVRRGRTYIRQTTTTPPTITSDVTARQLSGSPANATKEYRWSPLATSLSLRDVLRVYGGTPTAEGLLRQPVVTRVGSGNVQNLNGFNRDALSWGFETRYFGRWIEFMFIRAGGTSIQIEVNGQSLSADPIPNPGGSGNWYYGLDFGADSDRLLRVEMFGPGALQRIYTTTDKQLAPVPHEEPLRVVTVGDSNSASTGATRPNGAWQITLGKRAGWSDVRQVAIGSSGIINQGQVQSTFGDARRIADVVEANPDLLLMLLSGNDGDNFQANPTTYRAAVLDTLRRYRSALPLTPIWLGSIWPGLISEPASSRVDAMEAAAFEVFDQWADPNSWKFVDTRYGLTQASAPALMADAAHPNQAGHDYLAERWVDLIEAKFGITLS